MMNLRSRLSTLIAVRVVVSTLLLGSAILVQINRPGAFPIDPFFFLIGITYALSVLYLASLRIVDRHPLIADAQLGVDAFLVSAFIHVTGGITSYFSSLYLLPIMAAATVRFRRGALQVATLSAILYLALVSGSLAENLRSAGARLERASTQIADLRAFNQYVIDSMLSGLVTADMDGRILTFNRAASTITGLSAGQTIGRDIGEVLQLPAQFRGRLRTLGETRSHRADHQYRAPDGGVLDIGL